MKILFVKNGLRVNNGYEIGIMSLSSLLKSHGFITKLVDAKYSILKKEIKNNNFKILAFSISGEFVEDTLKKIKKIKLEFPDLLILLGGPHVTLFPEIIYNKGVDCICRGEGEYALLELLKKYRKGESLDGIKNWWVKKNSKIYRNDCRPLIKELDTLPFLDRELYNRETFPPDPDSQPMLASRGCFYNCKFCINSVYKELYKKQTIYRKRSIDSIFEELRLIKYRYSPLWIKFQDPLFPISDLEWLEEFSLKYKKTIKIPFFCMIRPDLVNSDNVKLLKEAGCSCVGIGIESGKEEVRKKIMGRNVSNQDVHNALKKFQHFKLRPIISNIGGVPGTTLEEDLETLKFNSKIDLDMTGIFPFDYSLSPFYPYPQLPLTKKGVELGIFKKRYFGKFNFEYIPTRKYSRKYYQIENLSSLFPFLAHFPYLNKFTNILIKLPLNSLYKFFFFTINLFIYIVEIILNRQYGIKKKFSKVSLSLANNFRIK